MYCYIVIYSNKYLYIYIYFIYTYHRTNDLKVFQVVYILRERRQSLFSILVVC